VALWESPIQTGVVGRITEHLNGALFQSWWYVSWLQHCDRSHEIHGCDAGDPAAKLDLSRVTPAYYVELRALEIRKDAIEAATSGRGLIGFARRALRLWPFRWPVSETPKPEPQPASPPPPDPSQGQFLDILS
jgi:hypothetical protein